MPLIINCLGVDTQTDRQTDTYQYANQKQFQEAKYICYKENFTFVSFQLLYSRNLLRKKIFANLAILLSEEIFANFEFNC